MTTDLERTIAERQQRIDHAIQALQLLRPQYTHDWPGAGTLGHVATTLEELLQGMLSSERELQGEGLIDAVARLASGSDPKSVGLCEDCAGLAEAAGFRTRIVAPEDCEVCEGGSLRLGAVADEGPTES